MVIRMNNLKGFSLIELMIVVAVIAILASIAYPSYQNYIKRTHRVEVQAGMMEIAQRLQSYKLVNGDFGKGNSNTAYAVNPLINPAIYGAVSFPKQGAARYSLSITASPDTNWTLTATPMGAQKGNGHVVLNNRNERCWTEASDKNSGVACNLSSTTNWDGK